LADGKNLFRNISVFILAAVDQHVIFTRSAASATIARNTFFWILPSHGVAYADWPSKQQHQ